MWFDCRYTYFPQPYDSELFLRSYEIDICSMAGNDEVLAGRLALDFLDLCRALDAGESVYDICDGDSAGWEHIYNILFEERDGDVELKAEFGFNEPVLEIVFLCHCVIHPSLEDWRMFILAHAAEMFSSNSAMVMWDLHHGLTTSQLTQLGFRKIAGQDLLFRPSMLRHPYSVVEDDRDTLELEVDTDAQEWVLQEWKRRTRQD